MLKNDKNIYKVSIGISALNEEGTIGGILDSILSQEQNGWILTEILVYSDGSTDRTVIEARKRNKLLVKVKTFKERKGKSYRLNQIFKAFRGDILVVFDADIKISNNNIITNLINRFRIEDKVVIVGGNSRVFPPTNFFERSIYTSYYVYFKSREELRGGDNVFACTGACIALRKDFTRQIRIPRGIINEDTFLYFSCLKAGYKFKYAPRAIVYYKIATNLRDFLRQMFRSSPEAVNLIYKKYFGGLIQREYFRPKIFYLKAISEIFIKNLLGTLYMISLKILTKPFYFYFSRNYKLSWYTAVSTKGKI